MKAIEISKYYAQRTFYPYMCARMFDALEAAFLAGASVALVRESDYVEMLERYAYANAQ